MLNLDSPRDGDTHTLADFGELLCLLTQDRLISRESIKDHVEAEVKLGDVDLDDAFGQFAWRAAAFGSAYPFALDAHGKILSAPDVLSVEQQAYALLLLCANLPFLPLAVRNAMTDAFERVSVCALRRIWPQSAEVRTFGKNQAQYTGNKVQRLTQLARDIGCFPQVTAATFRAGDSGDGGIDLVAWLELDDYEPRHKPSALAQCACSRDNWSAKQSEISHFRLGSLIVPTHKWTEMVFIPHCFRGNSGAWAVDGELASIVLVDRLRLIRQLDPANDWGEIAPPQLLPQFLAARLPV